MECVKNVKRWYAIAYQNGGLLAHPCSFWRKYDAFNGRTDLRTRVRQASSGAVDWPSSGIATERRPLKSVRTTISPLRS